MNGKQAYALSKKYTEESLEGAGALKGKSAYDIAVENGYSGTEEEWLDSLKGDGTGIVFEQSTPSSRWEITHSLNQKYPEVTCVDTDGNVIVGDIDYFSVNMLIITFCSPVSGKAIIK